MTNEVNDPGVDWLVTFEQLEDVQLQEMLKVTPAERLAMAEELLEFIILSKSAKLKK